MLYWHLENIEVRKQYYIYRKRLFQNIIENFWETAFFLKDQKYL